MKPISRIILAICALSMIGAYFFPLWLITLDAPQYPEGLTMNLWIDKLAGDINTINGLNHYIGMKHLSTELFPEFLYLKYIVAALICCGLITALSNNKKVLLGWVIILILIGIIGAYDFWQWEYDYGHNLNPTAAIKVPGMSYQPPLLGYKDLLNFTAGSFPDMGGYAVIIPAFLTVLVFIYEWFFNKKK
jgi:copper chaperone NosL